MAEFRGRRVALWGTREPYVTGAAAKCERDFGVHVISREDGFRDIDHYVKLARAHSPELIVLGMGMPKQEELAQVLRTTAAAPAALIVCGGAILDFLGGKVSRAPLGFQRIGMEWVYSLALEPRRLFKRYVLGNAAFLLRVLMSRKQLG
jgi:exopolysaccharide biosynthesis WecB/TagA/CpsF family protein